METFINTLIILFLIYLFLLLILARIRYSHFLELMRKLKPDYQENLEGLFVGDGGKFTLSNGSYWFRTPFYIHGKIEDPDILVAIKQHNKVIRLFWISVVTLIPTFIFIAHMIDR